MMLAQRLYEGVELGKEGAVGLITYMRTDSTRISDDAIGDVRELIARELRRASRCRNTQRPTKSKKGAQDAHEAIRPTSAALTPETGRASYLAEDELKLYRLIWMRFVACQMVAAVSTSHHRRRPRGRRLATTLPRHRLTPCSSGLPGGLREGKDQTDDEDEPRGCRRSSRRRVKLLAHHARAALHRAAAALHRSDAGQGARGRRRRPALDLREHHPDAALQEVLRAAEQALRADRPRQDRQPLPDRQLRALRRLRLHGRDGGRARQHLARRGGMDPRARSLLGRAQEADRRRRGRT